MAGAHIRIEFDDSELREALDRLVAANEDMTPLMQDIGEHLLNTTRERFASQEAPDGTPWAPLSETTKRRKRRNADKILTLDGLLRGTLAYRVGRDHVEVGSPLLGEALRRRRSRHPSKRGVEIVNTPVSGLDDLGHDQRGGEIIVGDTRTGESGRALNIVRVGGRLRRDARDIVRVRPGLIRHDRALADDGISTGRP